MMSRPAYRDALWCVDDIVGGVFVFRMFTYLGPILLGLVLWPVLHRMLRRSPAGGEAVIEVPEQTGPLTGDTEARDG
jgi:hypothetical protein